MKIALASNNDHKVEEIQSILGDEVEIITMSDLGFTEDIEEYGKTLEENARIKARALRQFTGLPVLSDDSGLEVTELNMAPGVYSARYAGPEKDDDKNISKLLDALGNTSNRSARFRTVLCFSDDTEERLFEGIVEGIISTKPRGTSGFGYDPVFVPDNHSYTFAELTNHQKNAISHRRRALEKLHVFLKTRT